MPHLAYGEVGPDVRVELVGVGAAEDVADDDPPVGAGRIERRRRRIWTYHAFKVCILDL